MTLLATAYPSEGISDEVHVAFWVIYAVAAMSGFVGIVMRLQEGWSPGIERNLAVAVLLMGLVPLAWELHLYHIDYFPVEMDGTPASPPVWKAMAIPVLPALCGLGLLVWRRSERR